MKVVKDFLKVRDYSGIELSDLGPRISNRFLYFPNQKQFIFF